MPPNRASPRLKDADVPPGAFPALYSELLLTTRKLFHECKLVHADLSEYNILYHVEPKVSSVDDSNDSPHAPDSEQEQQRHEQDDGRGHLYIIDVSQSVEHDHPHAFDFLRADLRNVEDFFSKRGVRCLGLRQAFEFVTKDSLAYEDGPETDLERRLATAKQEDAEDVSEDAAAVNGRSAVDEDSVFMRSYIPRTLNEVYDPERDVGALNRGEGEKLIYKDTIGIVASKDQAGDGPRKVQFADDPDRESDGNEASGSEDESEGEDEAEAGEFMEHKPRGHRHEDKEAKKVRNSIHTHGSHCIHVSHRNVRRLPKMRRGRSAKTKFQRRRKSAR